MSNGELRPAADRTLEGNIATLSMFQPFTLKPNADHKADNPDSPKYRAYAKSRAGGEVVIGAAWERTIERGPLSGQKMLSITLDDPSFDQKLSVTAFPREGGSYEIVWRRSRGSDGQDFKADEGRR